jgi:hypothetical protein
MDFGGVNEFDLGLREKRISLKKEKASPDRS